MKLAKIFVHLTDFIWNYEYSFLIRAGNSKGNRHYDILKTKTLKILIFPQV